MQAHAILSVRFHGLDCFIWVHTTSCVWVLEMEALKQMPDMDLILRCRCSNNKYWALQWCSASWCKWYYCRMLANRISLPLFPPCTRCFCRCGMIIYSSAFNMEVSRQAIGRFTCEAMIGTTRWISRLCLQTIRSSSSCFQHLFHICCSRCSHMASILKPLAQVTAPLATIISALNSQSSPLHNAHVCLDGCRAPPMSKGSSGGNTVWS